MLNQQTCRVSNAVQSSENDIRLVRLELQISCSNQLSYAGVADTKAALPKFIKSLADHRAQTESAVR
jgi:hypothetical protein